MVPSNRALATFYMLSMVTMSLSAAVWLQFSVEFQTISGHISETVRERTKVTINH